MVILLVEPDNILATTYKQYLEDLGYRLRCVASAVKALEAVDETKPDVILLEIQLARHNGIEFLYEIRSYSDLRSIPIIVVSQVHPSRITDNFKQIELLGIKHYLYKPTARLTDIRKAIESSVSQ